VEDSGEILGEEFGGVLQEFFERGSGDGLGVLRVLQAGAFWWMVLERFWRKILNGALENGF